MQRKNTQVKALETKNEGDFRTGVAIIVRALEEPIRQISANAGLEGSVIVANVRSAGKLGYGYDAAKNEYGIFGYYALHTYFLLFCLH